MARPISIRDEDILAAARQVFLERGIRGTSAEVAERAGVSEGSIFKRFPSKDQLFQAAMRVDMDATITFTRQMAERAGESDVRAGLLELGANILQMFRLLLPMMMMRWSNPDEHVEELRQDESPPLQLLAALMDYFGAAVAARRIRAIDVEILSRAFLGALQNYAFFEVLMRVRKENPTPAVTFLRRLVDGLWVGFSPNGKRPLKPAGTARGLHKKAPGKHKKGPRETAGNERALDAMNGGCKMIPSSKLTFSLAFGVATFVAAYRAQALQPLDEFRRSARAANFDVREAGLVTEQRGHEASVALGRLLPILSATAAYTRNQYEVSVARPSPGGETVTAVITPLDQLEANLGVRVPLIDVGGWLRLSASLRAEDAANLRAEATTNDGDAEVARHYYTLIGATWLRDAAVKAQAASEQNLDVFVRRREAERALDTDVLKARAEVERAKKVVAETDNQVRMAVRGLRTLSGLEPTAGVPAFEVVPTTELSRSELQARALTAPAVKAAEADRLVADKSRSAAWAAFAPTLSASANERVTNATGFANRNTLLTLQVAATWSLDYTTLAQARASSTAASLANVRAERARQVQLDYANDAADRVELQVVRARSAAAEEDAARQAVALWRDRLTAGNATALELVQSERDAFAATASRLQAEADLAYARELLQAKTKRALR